MNNKVSAMARLTKGDSLNPPTITPPNSRMVIGAIRVSRSARNRSVAKATEKLSRYRPSGSTHSSGIATISVVI